jgi:hypothetical protein
LSFVLPQWCSFTIIRQEIPREPGGSGITRRLKDWGELLAIRVLGQGASLMAFILLYLRFRPSEKLGFFIVI